MKRNSEAIFAWLSFLTAPFLMMGILLICYALKGIYPFGNGNISYYDMAQSFVPIYYHTYDVMHGTKDLFWDWYSGGGISMVDTSGNFIFSPFCILFWFVKREMLLESMSYLLIMKVCGCAFAMSFYTKKTFPKADWYWHVIAGVLYASSGFMVQYYSNIHFLEMVFYFPFLLYFFDSLLEKKRVCGYCFILALVFSTSMYYAYMICLYLILYGRLRMRRMEKEVQKKRAALFGISTLVAGLLSAVISGPTLLVLLQSLHGRMENARINAFFSNQKTFMVYGCEIVAAILVVLIFSRKKVFRKYVEQFIILFLMLIPIVVEETNGYWHIGGYIEFPMRFGYMVSFSAIVLFMKILSGEEMVPIVKKDDAHRRKTAIWGILAVCGTVIMGILLYRFALPFCVAAINSDNAYGGYPLIFCGLVVVFLLGFLANEKKWTGSVCVLLVLLQCFFGWYGFLAPVDKGPAGCEDDSIAMSEAIRREWNGMDTIASDMLIRRIKDTTMTLNSNYPLVLGRASMSTWTYGGKIALRETMQDMGYAAADIRLLDQGGTIYSDALLNIDTVITRDVPDEHLYRNSGVAAGYYFSDAVYDYPFGIVTSDAVCSWDGDDFEYALEYQNSLFRCLDDTSEELILTRPFSECFINSESCEDGYLYYYEIPIQEDGVLYMEIPTNDINGNYEIYINGQILKIPCIGDEENTTYPLFDYANGIVYCGCFEQGEIVSCILYGKNASEPEGEFGVLQLDVLRQSITRQAEYERYINVKGNSLFFDISVEEDGYLVLPIGFDQYCRITNNGVLCERVSGLNQAFFLIPLSVGDNDIKMEFGSPGSYWFVLLSLIGIGGLFILNKCIGGIEKNRFICGVMYWALFIVEYAILYVFYLFPILFQIIYHIFL